jgi:hypothetical protein
MACPIFAIPVRRGCSTPLTALYTNTSTNPPVVGLSIAEPEISRVGLTLFSLVLEILL